MAGIAAGWAALERAAGRDSAVYLKPISDEQHHLVSPGCASRRSGSSRRRASPGPGAGQTGRAPRGRAHRAKPEPPLRAGSPGRGERASSVQPRARPQPLRPAHRRARSTGVRRTGFRRCEQRIYAQVLTATGAICERLGRLISRCIAVFERRFGQGPSSRLGRGLDPDGVPPHADAPLYWAHRADLLARWQGSWPDPSRVDALIARRLRGGGRGEAAVAALITACAPGVPRIGRHAWQGYGRRAAAHAFRTDMDDGAWVVDRTSSAMWTELEQAVKKRGEAQTMRPVPVPQPPPLLPASQPQGDKTRSGTTRRTGRRDAAIQAVRATGDQRSLRLQGRMRWTTLGDACVGQHPRPNAGCVAKTCAALDNTRRAGQWRAHPRRCRRGRGTGSGGDWGRSTTRTGEDENRNEGSRAKAPSLENPE